MKTQFNKSRKQSVEEIIELKNDDSRDWWTKYFASVESAIIEVRTRVNEHFVWSLVYMNVSLVSQENRKTAYGDTNGLLPIQMEPAQIDAKPTKKSTKASRFVAKLSPKKFQRKREVTKIATMKVKKKNF